MINEVDAVPSNEYGSIYALQSKLNELIKAHNNLEKRYDKLLEATGSIAKGFDSHVHNFRRDLIMKDDRTSGPLVPRS